MVFLNDLLPFLMFFLGVVVGVFVPVALKRFEFSTHKRNLRVQNEVNMLYRIEAEVSSMYQLLVTDEINLSKKEINSILKKFASWTGKYPHGNVPKYGVALFEKLTLYRDNNSSEKRYTEIKLKDG